MAAALRSVRRLQQVLLLLPRIGVTPVRGESGGKGSLHTGDNKTLVIFPVKASHFQKSDAGENRNGTLRPVAAPLLEVGRSGRLSDREMQSEQKILSHTDQCMDGSSHIEDDSGSDSSSDSSSDSESEEEIRKVTRVNKGHSSGELRDWSPSAQTSSHSPSPTSLEKECLVAQEQKVRTGLSKENAEDMQDFAQVVTVKEKVLHAPPLHSKMTILASDKVKTVDRSGLSEGADSEDIVIPSTFEVLPSETVETPASDSSVTHILSSTSSVELPVSEKTAELQKPYLPLEPRAAPKEPFDNTKYQNLQHFSYTPFTFVDVDVELAKLRLPQPSSGRPSPRH
ncbi:NADH dehydrogenase [ubiquinone] flavoprotein 3, mitochondrial isoform X1 [Ranitomeya imitator]|uniref:NADH dehydrogenase [ubiquinone] flavoprotein 3, mitochondrial isoform X1 n=1 Tax=Ranitomeya imitator TaxID=111125 RepID=UPI0037E98C01